MNYFVFIKYFESIFLNNNFLNYQNRNILKAENEIIRNCTFNSVWNKTLQITKKHGHRFSKKKTI